jgi:hypothetical protein
MTMTQTIEFTDRYGGKPPAWLTSCHECEAMGFSPEPCPRENGGGSGPAPVDLCPRPDEHMQADFDGWHFLRCTACAGSARVSRIAAISRIPRWTKKSFTFFWTMSDRKYQPAHFTYWQHVWLVFKCAFIYEIKRLLGI